MKTSDLPGGGGRGERANTKTRLKRIIYIENKKINTDLA